VAVGTTKGPEFVLSALQFTAASVIYHTTVRSGVASIGCFFARAMDLSDSWGSSKTEEG